MSEMLLQRGLMHSIISLIMKNKKWPWWKILLWAYSVLWVGLVLVVGLIDPTTSSVSTTSAQDGYIAMFLFAPVLIFLILEGIDNLRN